MNKTKIGIFLSLMLVLGFCSSCGEKKANSKLLLNEVLINNESNFQDDYRSALPYDLLNISIHALCTP